MCCHDLITFICIGKKQTNFNSLIIYNAFFSLFDKVNSKFVQRFLNFFEIFYCIFLELFSKFCFLTDLGHARQVSQYVIKNNGMYNSILSFLPFKLKKEKKFYTNLWKIMKEKNNETYFFIQ